MRMQQVVKYDGQHVHSCCCAGETSTTSLSAHALSKQVESALPYTATSCMSCVQQDQQMSSQAECTLATLAEH
jgi:hypothetical protein